MASRVDHPVLQAGAVFDGRVESLCAFAAEGERLGHESVFSEADWLDGDAHGCLFLSWSVDVYLSFKSSFARGAEIPPERGEHE